jgi:exopolyphosphatase/guanosine-5'-triphosphate,3'-diphosphate pyrophosphatase
MTKLAAIDIGSNAIRLFIKHIDNIKKSYNPEIQLPEDYFTRVPIRLGDDVYSSGRISTEKEQLLINTLKHFRVLMEVYHVEKYRACGTASFRDAENGEQVAAHIQEQTGIKVDIISGYEEAALARLSFYAQYGSTSGDYLFCDVGGGSTDVCFCHDAQQIHAHSFAVGSMRMINHTQKDEDLKLLSDTLSSWTAIKNSVNIVGSGGSIHKIAQIFSNDATPNSVTVKNLCQLRNELALLTTEEKMARYHLKRDRAEIIVEAADIFIRIARAVGAEVIQAPVIGVRDGIIVSFLQKKASSK